MIYGIIAAVIVVVVLLVIIKAYNSLIVLRNRVDNQSSQVDVQLKRRADLIPNLIETTKGYANFEQSTLVKVTEMRSKIKSASSMKEANDASNELGRELSRIFALSENYPELKANSNFLALQKELSDTEQKISVSRQFYNDTVTKYNDAIMVFPRSIVAGMFGFKKKELLTASEEEKKSVNIKEGTFSF